MRALAIIAASTAAFALASTTAGAQDKSDSSGEMHGSPNANGYDKDKGTAPPATSATPPAGNGSGKMTGPPNANGMQRDDPRK